MYNREKLIEAIVGNESSFLTALAKLRKCQWHVEEYYSWVLNGDNKRPSAIFDINFQPNVVGQSVNRMVERIREGQLPNMVRTNPLTKPLNYHKYFIESGLELASETVGMAIELDTLDSLDNSVESLDIIELTRAEHVLPWCEVICKELFRTEDAVDEFVALTKLMLNDSRFKCFVGLCHGRVASASIIYMEDKIAGVYFAATGSEYRRRGYGGKITYEAIKHAKNVGCKIGILHASDMGKHVYERLGFQPYCKLGRYKLKV